MRVINSKNGLTLENFHSDERRSNQRILPHSGKNPTPIATVARPAESAKFQRARIGLRLLFDAYNYARRLNQVGWEFAEEIKSLRHQGLTNGDLRWLVCNGLVEHGREITKTGQAKRKFEKVSGLSFSKKTCFVLTAKGASRVLQNGLNPPADEKARWTPVAAPDHCRASQTPTWDRELQELRVGLTIVKQFKVPARNQETILAVFEEDDWPVYIDDPLPRHPDIDPKRRLHDTINSLNRSQKNQLIQFRGNGSGEGVRWEFLNSL